VDLRESSFRVSREDMRNCGERLLRRRPVAFFLDV
jgi:hypothetical protein